jgi:hypothetical protein
MGPTSITAPYKLVFEYLNTPLPHKVQMYLPAVTAGSASGWQTVPRPTFSAVDMFVAIDAFWTKLGADMFAASVTFGQTIFQQRVGTTYIDVFSYSTAVTPSGSFASGAAWGTQISMVDVTNKRCPVYIGENENNAPSKATTPTGVGTGTPPRALCDFFCGTGASIADSDAYVWRVSRSNAYVASFKSYVVDTNEKYRRLRNLK